MKTILFFFSDTLIGGAETNILKISQELHKLGHKIHFASLDDNGPLLNGVDFFESYTKIGRYEKNIWSSYQIYKKLIKTHNIDIVSAFGLRVDIFVRLLTKTINPKVRIVGNIRASESWRNFFHVFLDRATKHCVDLWASNSVAAKKVFVEREKIEPDKIQVIYNFIERSTFSIQYRESDLLRIGILANYKATKGHYNLIPISKELLSKDVNFEFLCAGFDYTNGDLAKKIKLQGLENRIVLQGYQSDKDKFFKSIDVLFLPSFIEGIPTCIIEAMSCGVPIIASEIDGIPEVIKSGYNGFLRDPNDIVGFVEDIIRMKSAKLRQRFADASYHVLNEKFDKQNNMKKWAELFASLN